jgi:hypothetical protein
MGQCPGWPGAAAGRRPRRGADRLGFTGHGPECPGRPTGARRAGRGTGPDPEGGTGQRPDACGAGPAEGGSGGRGDPLVRIPDGPGGSGEPRRTATGLGGSGDGCLVDRMMSSITI